MTAVGRRQKGKALWSAGLGGWYFTFNYVYLINKELTQLKKEITWLSEVDKFALENSLKNLETAYKNFFADLKKLKNTR